MILLGDVLFRMHACKLIVTHIVDYYSLTVCAVSFIPTCEADAIYVLLKNYPQNSAKNGKRPWFCTRMYHDVYSLKCSCTSSTMNVP